MPPLARPALVVLAVLGIALGVFALARTGDGKELRAGACPRGFSALSDEYLRELRGGARPERQERESGERARPDRRRVCLRDGVRRPEPFADLARANEAATTRLGLDRPGAYAAAVRQKRRLDSTTIPGTAGAWTPVGSGPLIFDDPDHPDNFGLSRGAGRITDFAYDQRADHLFAAVASGGVWLSTDRAGSWRSIGDTLPTQTVGAVGFTPAGGGTVIALTGDNAFGGNTYAGNGIYWSDDLGANWHKARGAPEGAQGFRVVVRADEPDTAYAATGAGLYRSTDAGRSWANVSLPTGECAGAPLSQRGCALANVVTDVQVQAADAFGNRGGAVTAAVGWRDGRRVSIGGVVEAPANGIYVSDSGSPGSFSQIPDSAGFLSSKRVGRVSLGSASGPKQNHDYLYALVQDSVLFNSGKVEGIDVPGGDPTGLGLDATPTYLDGVYVSSNFGRSWRKIATRPQFLAPTNGSTLAQLAPLGFGPGIQSWYNSWIQPDPYAQIAGIPTRLDLGLEEVFESRTTGLPQATPTDFQAVGPYATLGGPCIITLSGQVCGKLAQATGRTTLHPDQHAAIFLPGAAGSTLVVGNDGGAYTQKVPRLGNLSPAGFGKGAQEGFHTLLPYGVAVARDGVIYAGLQDNGEIRIDPKTGRQVEIFGGDGTFTLVEPDNSDAVLEATPNGGFNASTDGGRTFRAVGPSSDGSFPFLAPMVMDPRNSKRLAIAGNKVFTTDAGIGGLAETGALTPEGLLGDGSTGDGSWKSVFDLGTASKPGEEGAEPGETDPENIANAVGIDGETLYVGFCGTCDPVRENRPFKGGVATNVGGTWHIAKAGGLPRRIINHVAVDPKDPRTVYVALGTGSARPFAAPGSLIGDALEAPGGFVYRSTDGGESFTDITGDLPKAGATWLLVRDGQLLAATPMGVFASRTKAGREWGQLGDDLPAATVFSMTLDPADSDRLVIASLGRGVYSYRFRDPAPGCRDRTAPRSRLTAPRGRALRAHRRVALRGTASDRGCGKRTAARLRRVSVSVAKRKGARCRYLRADGAFERRRRSCARPRYVRAVGTRRWRLTTHRLSAGRYVVRHRARDAAGNRERTRPLALRVR